MFKVGDKVRVTCNYCWHGFDIDSIVTIVKDLGELNGKSHYVARGVDTYNDRVGEWILFVDEIAPVRLKKINKTQARKAYNNVKTVYLLPNKVDITTGDLNMLSPTLVPALFDDGIYNFEYFNCNHVNGRYTAFYIEEEVK